MFHVLFFARYTCFSARFMCFFCVFREFCCVFHVLLRVPPAFLCVSRVFLSKAPNAIGWLQRLTCSADVSVERVATLRQKLYIKPGAGIMEADDRQVTTVFTVQPSFHHRHSTNRVSRNVSPVNGEVGFDCTSPDDGNGS